MRRNGSLSRLDVIDEAVQVPCPHSSQCEPQRKAGQVQDSAGLAQQRNRAFLSPLAKAAGVRTKYNAPAADKVHPIGIVVGLDQFLMFVAEWHPSHRQLAGAGVTVRGDHGRIGRLVSMRHQDKQRHVEPRLRLDFHALSLIIAAVYGLGNPGLQRGSDQVIVAGQLFQLTAQRSAPTLPVGPGSGAKGQPAFVLRQAAGEIGNGLKAIG